jgi:hypothetical protein
MSGYPLRSVLELRRREEEAALARLADAMRERTKIENDGALKEIHVMEARARLRAARGGGPINGGGPGEGGGTAEGAAAGPAEGAAELTGGCPADPAVAPAAPAATGAAAAEQARFVARRRDELLRAEADLARFRSGSLLPARIVEQKARGAHLAARQAREAFSSHEARFLASAVNAKERREEEAGEEVARVARHPRGGQG